MPIALASIANLLQPGLRGVYGEYENIPRQYDKIYSHMASELAVERTVEARFLGPAQLKNEGQSVQFDNNAGQRFIYNQEHIELALGYAITRKAVDDNLYKTQFRPSNLGLVNSFAQTKEIYAASVFNTGGTLNTSIVGDGQPLFSTAHPVDGGTYANRPTVDVDLNEATLLSGMIQIRRGYVDQAGLKFYARAKKLLVPPELEPTAIRLMNAELRPGTPNNDPNAIRSTASGLPEGYMVWDYLTSPYAWSMLTNVEGLSYMERVPFEITMDVEFTTDNLLVKGYERYSFGYWNPRAVWGTLPTS